MPSFHDKTLQLLSAKRGPKRLDPTMAAAVDAYIEQCRMAQKASSVPSTVSVLKGGQRATKRSAGTPLARSHLGELKTHRVSADDLVHWFNERHRGLAADTRKRGSSALRGLVYFCISRGWMGLEMLHACVRVEAGASTRHWLTPEAVAALIEALEATTDPRFDAYWRFSLRVDLETGIRPGEKQDLVPGDVDPGERVLHIRHGKGHGEGKPRKITVSDDFIAAWRVHAQQFELRADHRVFFRRERGKSDGVEDAWRIEDRALPCSKGAFRTTYRALTEIGRSELPWNLAPSFAITPKVMRRTFACLNCIAHARHEPGARDLRQLQAEMGHASLETTALYLSDVESYLQREAPRVSVTELVRRLTA